MCRTTNHTDWICCETNHAVNTRVWRIVMLKTTSETQTTNSMLLATHQLLKYVDLPLDVKQVYLQVCVSAVLISHEKTAENERIGCSLPMNKSTIQSWIMLPRGYRCLQRCEKENGIKRPSAKDMKVPRKQ